MNKTSRDRGRLLVLLEAAQDKSAHISRETITELAESLDISIGEVYGPCLLKNAQTVIDSVRKELGIKPGETTTDGRFSFELTNCIGACDKAPAMMVNSDVHGDLTSKKITKILQGYK